MLGLWHNPVFAQETHLTLLHSNDMAGRFEQILKAGAIKKQIEQKEAVSFTRKVTRQLLKSWGYF